MGADGVDARTGVTTHQEIEAHTNRALIERARRVVVVFGLLLVAAVFVHNQWAGLLALPVLVYPFIFLADLWFILYTYGHSIDPTSALGGAIKPFTPPLLGEGTIGQFRTLAELGPGFFLSLAALGVVLVGLSGFHRAAYKPIVDARRALDSRQSLSRV